MGVKMKKRKILTKLGIIFGIIDLLLILFGVIFLKPKQVLAETPDSFLMNELYLFNRDTFDINPNFEDGYLMKTTILPTDINNDNTSGFFGWYQSLGYRNLIIPYYGSDNDNQYVVFGIPLNGITASNFQIAYSVDTPTLLDFYLIFSDGTYEEWNTEDYGFNQFIEISNTNRTKNCYAFCWEAYSPDYVPSFKFFGVSDGYDLGYQHGKTTGFESGFNSGYNNGYNQGYQDGISSDNILYTTILNFNQLILNGDFNPSVNYWIKNSNSIDLIYHEEENAGEIKVLNNQDSSYNLGIKTPTINIESNHIYYSKITAKGDRNFTLRVLINPGYGLAFNVTTNYNTFDFLSNAGITQINYYPLYPEDLNNNESYYLRNIQLFDLTSMYGAGNEPTIEQCREIFTQDYYNYTESTPVEIGYYTGYLSGKDDGIQQGINIGETNQINMSWIQSIFQAMQGFFNIQIFPRVTLGIIVGIPFIISLAWFVIKMFRGGGGGED